MFLLKSTYDASVNFIKPFARGTIEYRYVRRSQPYISVYVSSHSGCNQGCKMCHLTATKQTTFDHVSPDLYKAQLGTVLSWYKKNSLPAERVNVNFMARGEPMSNRYMVNNYSKIYDGLKGVVDRYNLVMKPNISTMMPKHLAARPLTQIFTRPAYLYYSLYSINPAFRQKWIPGAMDYRKALDLLKVYQIATGLEFTFHWAYIRGENDSIEEAHAIAHLLRSYEFDAKFNLVRYNPPTRESEEPPEDHLKELFSIVNSGLGNNPKSKIVSRVGYDINASCGMFVSTF